MMNNPLMGMIMQMMGQSGGNPQAMAQQILSQNPEFARQLHHHLLEDVFGLTPEYCYGETVSEIASAHPGNKLLIRVEGHLTCSMYGVVIDAWDCTDKVVDCFWII